MSAVHEWQPGDPVYPEQGLTIRGACGPCLVAWTADTDRCPECGELSTEALRAAVDRVRARHPMESRTYPNAGTSEWCGWCERPWPCREIAALDGDEPAPF